MKPLTKRCPKCRTGMDETETHRGTIILGCAECGHVENHKKLANKERGVTCRLRKLHAEE